MHGIICMWSGNFSDIPDGWAICDGTNGTPNLGNRFIVNAGPVYYPPHQKGGSYGHVHSATASTEFDTLESGDEIVSQAPDGHYIADTIGHTHTLNVAITYNFPPYYALCFIMKL